MKRIKDQYLWELGTQLVLEVQAQDLIAAENTFLVILNIIGIKHRGKDKDFNEMKLRVLQILTNVDRAAYYAGANPLDLSLLNMRIVDKIIKIKTRQQLISLGKNTLKHCITLIPDKDLFEAGKIKKALEYIREHCKSDISRSQVAALIDCSPSHLSRMFSKITGYTFKEIVLKYKIENAKELLENSRLNITEVSYEIGYKDPNYFTSTFKRITGVTPSQYRKKVVSRFT